MSLTRIKTYSGLDFDVRMAAADDSALLAEFWRNIPPHDLLARSTDIDDPSHPHYPGFAAAGKADQTPTFLAFGGTGTLISVAILVHARHSSDARVSVFTGGGITSHGVSWALLDHVLRQARAVGVETVESVFDVRDVRAIGLEQRMGFVETEFPDNPQLRILRWTFAKTK